MSFSHILRIPPILIMDKLFKYSFGFSNFTDIIDHVNSTLIQIEIGESTQYYIAFIKITVSCLSKFNKLQNKYKNTDQVIQFYFYFSVFISSLFLLVLPARCLFLVYIHVISVCVVLFSYWANMQILEIISEEYKNVKTNMINEVITWDVDGIIHVFTQLQIVNYLSLILFSIILQYCLSVVNDILLVLTTNHSTHEVNINYNNYFYLEYEIIQVLQVFQIFKFSLLIISTLIVSILGMHRILNKLTILSTLLQSFSLLKILWLNIFKIKKFICDGYNYIQEIK